MTSAHQTQASRVQGLKGFFFRVLGLRVSGFRVLGFEGLGFRVQGLSIAGGLSKASAAEGGDSDRGRFTCAGSRRPKG